MFNNRIVKNASWIIGCKIGQSILSLVITMMTARFLGPSNYGVINYAAAIVAFVAPIVQLGLGDIQVQELVNNPEEEGKIVGTSLLLSIMSAVFGIAGVIAFAVISNPDDKLTITVCCLYSVVLLFQGAELIQGWFQSKLLAKYYSIVSLIAFVVVSIYKSALLIKGKSVTWFAVSSSLDYLIILLVLLLIYLKLGGTKLKFSKKTAQRLLKSSKHYIMASLMTVIFTQTDRIMINIMLDSQSTGVYSVAITSASLANFVFTAIIDSVRPRILQAKKTNENEFVTSMSMLYSIIIYAGVIFSALISVFAWPIIYIIYGSGYLGAVLALRLVAWYVPFAFIGTVRNIWLLANEKQKMLPLINTLGALANIFLNYLFIPIWGIEGAAIASLVTQFFTNVFISYIIKDIRQNIYLMINGMNPKFVMRFIKR